jgi:hypothetical protein
MKTVIFRPYFWLWISIPLVLGLGFACGECAIDIPLHDYYFIIELRALGVWAAILLGVLGLFYWLLRRKGLARWMTVVHVALTLGMFFWVLAAHWLVFLLADENIQVPEAPILVIVLLGILSQILFLVNAGRGLTGRA